MVLSENESFMKREVSVFKKPLEGTKRLVKAPQPQKCCQEWRGWFWFFDAGLEKLLLWNTDADNTVPFSEHCDGYPLCNVCSRFNKVAGIRSISSEIQWKCTIPATCNKSSKLPELIYSALVTQQMVKLRRPERFRTIQTFKITLTLLHLVGYF